MENKELLQYLKDAIEVETDLATQEQILDNGLAEIEGRKPVLYLDTVPQITANPVPKKPSYVIWGYVLLGLGIPIFLFSLPYLFYGRILWVLIAMLFLIPACIIISKANDYVNNEKAQYDKQKITATNIQKKNTAKQKEFDAAIRSCNFSLSELRSTGQAHITETKALLGKLYDKNIIYPKYCTLPALTSIYEYFMTGRCTELTGPHGAYNLYEDEVRKDTIINRLDTVIENLEQIRNNQYMLYQQVKSIKENTDIMVSELRQIKGYSIAIAELTALNAYYASLNERNTRIMMYYQL